MSEPELPPLFEAELKIIEQRKEIERLRDENSTLRTNFDLKEQINAHNIEEIERLRYNFEAQSAQNERLVAEIERLRDKARSAQLLYDTNSELQEENERLRGLLQWWLDAGPDADWDEHEKRVRKALRDRDD